MKAEDTTYLVVVQRLLETKLHLLIRELDKRQLPGCPSQAGIAQKSDPSPQKKIENRRIWYKLQLRHGCTDSQAWHFRSGFLVFLSLRCDKGLSANFLSDQQRKVVKVQPSRGCRNRGSQTIFTVPHNSIQCRRPVFLAGCNNSPSDNTESCPAPWPVKHLVRRTSIHLTDLW